MNKPFHVCTYIRCSLGLHPLQMPAKSYAFIRHNTVTIDSFILCKIYVRMYIYYNYKQAWPLAALAPCRVAKWTMHT